MHNICRVKSIPLILGYFCISGFASSGNRNIYKNRPLCSVLTAFHIDALAAWRSGHRTHLKSRRPGFESFQGIRFLGKTKENLQLCLTD
jgi:hypothetical protein